MFCKSQSNDDVYWAEGERMKKSKTTRNYDAKNPPTICWIPTGQVMGFDLRNRYAAYIMVCFFAPQFHTDSFSSNLPIFELCYLQVNKFKELVISKRRLSVSKDGFIL